MHVFFLILLSQILFSSSYRMDFVNQIQEELATKMQATAQEYCRDASVVRTPLKRSILKGMILMLPNVC